ncbi:hypothetical protein EV360DRAFT_74077 [Lentinula raphanica]|nr:hypothetical protein EV360DRAFT_74077 [Lentinula raphanica]
MSSYSCRSSPSVAPDVSQLDWYNDNLRKDMSSKQSCLTLSMPASLAKSKVFVALGSPFTPSTIIGSYSDTLTDVGSENFPPDFHPASYESSFESDTESEFEEDRFEEEEEDAQYISIPSTSTFYHLPPKPRPFACAFRDTSFSCDALAEEGSFQIQPSTLFHKSLSPVFHSQRKSHDHELDVIHPHRQEEDLQLLSLSEVWELASRKPLPDVPQGIDSEEFEHDDDLDTESEPSSSDSSDKATDFESGSRECCIATGPSAGDTLQRLPTPQ